MIAEPPLLDGAVHDTVARAAPETPETDVGASGRPMGVVGSVVAAGPVPMRLVAVTLTTYEVPFLRPVMVQPLSTAPIDPPELVHVGVVFAVIEPKFVATPAVDEPLKK